MKTVLRLVCVFCVLKFYINPVQAASATTNKSGFQLTIELRDGSRVVGKTLENTLSFHSSMLGDVKVSWASIRSIEYPADIDAARLTATNGDGFTVQLTADTLRVETGFGQTELPVKLIRSIKVMSPKLNVAATPAAAGEVGSRLTIELRDGSHVVGKGLDDTLNFHSSAVGDSKLPWSGIRSIEYADTNNEMAQLTATNGDVYEIQFTADRVRVETSFGKNELPVKLIRSIKVSAMTTSGQLPSGLIGLWSGEDNANDSAGTNNGNLTGSTTFGSGKVGQGFVFDGRNGSGVTLGNPASLQLQDFTIEAWIKRGNNRVVSYGSGGNASLFDSGWGGGYLFGMAANGELFFDRLGDVVPQQGPFITDTDFHHVALTKVGSAVIFYLDGTAYPVPSYTTTFTFTSSIGFGYQSDSQDNSFLGMLDEIGFFNRALSASEIQAIYTEQQ
jgi:Concanavalin A-like lectin/glucanases superfamily